MSTGWLACMSYAFNEFVLLLSARKQLPFPKEAVADPLPNIGCLVFTVLLCNVTNEGALADPIQKICCLDVTVLLCNVTNEDAVPDPLTTSAAWLLLFSYAMLLMKRP